MEIDINPTNKQTISDDPELAKVLAGVNSGAAVSDDSADNQDDDLQYETLNSETNTPEEVPTEEAPIEIPTPPEVTEVPINFTGAAAGLGDLESIKNLALQDLRPLVDKLNATNEEKFDIYLLLLRSSDDKTLIEPAYNTARTIEDEPKRANALLDIIKEIDYFNSKK